MDDRLEQVMRAALAMQRHNWEQGVVAQAFLEAGDERTGLLMAVEAANRQTEDGRCAQLGASKAATDPCAVGEALIRACEMTDDPALQNARDRLLDWALNRAPRNSEGIVYHLTDAREFWVDSMYMLPPFLARAGYYDEALKQIDGYWRALYHADNGLLSHRWDDGTGRFVRSACWGVGNGWAAAGLARVIALLPGEYAAPRSALIARADALLRAALRHQRPDGLFHDVLDDPDSFREVNAGQMFAYTIYRGVREGWLDASLLSAAERVHEAVLHHVDQYGCVRDVCGAPSFDAPGVAPEGQAFFILMETARGRLTSAARSSSDNNANAHSQPSRG